MKWSSITTLSGVGSNESDPSWGFWGTSWQLIVEMASWTNKISSYKFTFPKQYPLIHWYSTFFFSNLKHGKNSVSIFLSSELSNLPIRSLEKSIKSFIFLNFIKLGSYFRTKRPTSGFAIGTYITLFGKFGWVAYDNSHPLIQRYSVFPLMVQWSNEFIHVSILSTAAAYFISGLCMSFGRVFTLNFSVSSMTGAYSTSVNESVKGKLSNSKFSHTDFITSFMRRAPGLLNLSL